MFESSGLLEDLGKDRFFSDKQTALDRLSSKYETDNDSKFEDLSSNVKQMVSRSKVVVTSNHRFLL